MSEQTRYAKSGAVHIAYQIWGEGPYDMLFIPDWITHTDLFSGLPELARFLERLSGFGRLIMMDMRGVGASDAVAHEETQPSDWIGDIAAVMAAAGSDRAALIGLGHGGQHMMLFAAAHPEAVSSLILMNSYARLARADDYRPGMPITTQEKAVAALSQNFGTGNMIYLLAPSIANNPGAIGWWAKTERLSASPGRAIAKQRAIFATDVREVLPQIKVPTLIVHSKDHMLFRADHARYLNECIAGSRYCELPGSDHWPLSDLLYAEIEEFVTGQRPAPEPERILATLLFTDIVGSTEKVTAIGDSGWRNVLDAHDCILRDCVARYGGRIANWAGDGVLATFNTPTRAIRCAMALHTAIQPLGLELRAGVHTGEVEDIDRLRGITVHIAARVAAAAPSGRIMVTSTVRDLTTGSNFRFEDRGVHALKGVADEWRLFVVGS
jgi:class 3 adenylate cyclase